MKEENEFPFCKCGCGMRVKKITNRYICGHSGGGAWQTKYDKNSIEYKEIVEKIKKSTSESMTGVKKSKEHGMNISIGRKKWIKENRDVFVESMEKMKKTKQYQSVNGILSKNHYVNNRDKKEVSDIYNRISKKACNTKNIKKELGIYPDIWNKGKNKFNDKRIAKYSRDNHYLWNPNKEEEYDEKFYNPDYRKYLLERQESKCLFCGNKNNLCLHHIDMDKQNSNNNNLIYVCRSHHSKIHNNYEEMTLKIRRMLDGLS